MMARGDCLHFLSQGSLGRIAFTARALPTIRALAYSLDGEDVLLQLTSATLAERLDGQVVAFAVDALPTASAPGWNVVLTGVARRWGENVAAQGPEHGVRIVPGIITGLWIGSVSPAPPTEAPATSTSFRHPLPESC